MRRTVTILVLLGLAGCAGLPTQAPAASPCAAGESSWACQVERYNNVATQ